MGTGTFPDGPPCLHEMLQHSEARRVRRSHVPIASAKMNLRPCANSAWQRALTMRQVSQPTTPNRPRSDVHEITHVRHTVRTQRDRDHCVSRVCAQHVLLQGHGEPHEAVTAGLFCLRQLSPSNIRVDNFKSTRRSLPKHGACRLPFALTWTRHPPRQQGWACMASCTYGLASLEIASNRFAKGHRMRCAEPHRPSCSLTELA